MRLNSSNSVMTLSKKIKAIIWDFDGTLVDTSLKNFNVAKQIIADLTGEEAESFPIFQSLETYNLANRSYKNWREMYKAEYGFSEEETDRAGSLWTEYQLRDDTPIEFFPGLGRVIKSLKEFPQGIVSMNSQSHIKQTLAENKISDLFQFVVGYEEVDMRKQKPEPDGLLLCLEKLTGLASGYVFYIGDHETDVKCAANANRVLREQKPEVKILTIGAFYGSGKSGNNSWEPDYRANQTEEIIDIIKLFQI